MTQAKNKPLTTAKSRGKATPAKKTAATRGLGRGIGALLEAADLTTEKVSHSVVMIRLNEISPTTNQPRQNFDQERLAELAASIKANGIIQPLILRRGDAEKTYHIVAGERRWRAARLAGLTEVPAIVRELSDREVLQQAIIENIQREDLNPIEEAEAFDRLLSEYQMTQEQLSGVIGRSRPAIANTLRLLKLPQTVRDEVIEGALSAGHARALLGLPDAGQQSAAAETVVRRQLSVRETEQLVKRLLKSKPAEHAPAPHYLLALREVETKLTRALGTKVRLRDRQGKGSIVIQYHDNDELSALIDRLTQTEN